ncbi:MAG: NAD(P)/FAD-dependent oxidoreductase [Rhodospirillaceae bacterium]|nr:NAD(P)/FAD-dependent oxidoreductase [Rhodospirillaceae bacterium]
MTDEKKAEILPGDRFDAVIVGAGFTGLYMLHVLRQKGFTARLVDAASGVGGTWYWNRYPGARCDIESMQYSFQFSEELQQEWEWTERYASQPEILAYIEHVAERFDLTRDIQFDTRVEAATFNEDTGEWMVETDRGQALHARYFIMGVGCLSAPIKPTFEGEADFTGETYQTSIWPKEPVDFKGKRVGIIGVGSSAIQAGPLIAEEAEHVYIYQRTPNYVVPSQNRPLTPEEVRDIKSDYKGFRAKAYAGLTAFLFERHDQSVFDLSPDERRARFDDYWNIGGLPFLGAFNDILFNDDANQACIDYWRSRIEEIIDDPKLVDLLTPDEEFGCKRLCSGTGFYEMFNRDNVTLVDVRGTGIERFTPTGLRAEGVDYNLDTIIFATGFDAMTGSVTRIRITGKGGQTIQQKWAEGPKTYLGLMISGFPNMFNMVSAGSPSVLATMVTAAEQHGDWVGECLDHMRETGKTVIEATPEAEAEWSAEVKRAGDASLRTNCDSWYVGSNIEGKARAFAPYIGGWPPYVARCNAETASKYENCVLSAV